MELARASREPLVAASERRWLATQRIFFGHQSVGQNIVDGMKDLVREDATMPLTVVLSDRPDLIAGPALIHATVGRNGDPASKGRDFRDTMARGFATAGGVAFFKFCYADFRADTDVDALLAEYRRTVDEVRSRFPQLTLVHVTAPLMTVEEPVRDVVKRLLRRPTRRALDATINRYNDLLRSAYREGPLFDLAQWESTRADGSRSVVLERGEPVYTLAPEWTSDGGHLNVEGRRRIAAALVAFLSTLRDRPAS